MGGRIAFVSIATARKNSFAPEGKRIYGNYLWEPNLSPVLCVGAAILQLVSPQGWEFYHGAHLMITNES